VKKDIFIIIIIVCLFLILAEFSCISAELDNYKNIWDVWSNYQRDIYLWGLRDGLRELEIPSPSLLISPDYRYYTNDPSSPYYSAEEQRAYYESRRGERREIMMENKAIEGCSEESKKAIAELKKKEQDEKWKTISIIIDFGKPETLKVIRDIVTDIYKDPANSYIYLSDICYLAFWKLNGKDIDPILIELRKNISEFIRR